MKLFSSSARFIAIAVLFLGFATAASADECKKYEVTAPPGTTLLTGNEINAMLSGNTVDAWSSGYRFYFAPDGNLTTEARDARGRMLHGTWKICGDVLVMETRPFGGRILERLVTVSTPDHVTVYELTGRRVAQWKIVKGKDFG
ncbi:MAG: hypothetical protein AAB932_05500 [Patescibacteria group bacterium]